MKTEDYNKGALKAQLDLAAAALRKAYESALSLEDWDAEENPLLDGLEILRKDLKTLKDAHAS